METQMMLLLLMLLHVYEHECNEHLLYMSKVSSAGFVRVQYVETQSKQPEQHLLSGTE